MFSPLHTAMNLFFIDLFHVTRESSRFVCFVSCVRISLLFETKQCFTAHLFCILFAHVPVEHCLGPASAVVDNAGNAGTQVSKFWSLCFSPWAEGRRGVAVSQKLCDNPWTSGCSTLCCACVCVTPIPFFDISACACFTCVPRLSR